MSTAEIIAELPRLSREELAQVQAKLLELAEPTHNNDQPVAVSAHPALGIWKDRTDLPDDSIEASRVLRERMMHRDGAATDATGA